MKNIQTLSLALIIVLSLLLQSCELAGDILEFGFWVGAIFVALIVMLVIFIIRKFKK